MPEIETVKPAAEAARFMEDLCRNLFKEWLFDLTAEEKEIWLWNASVEMHKVRQRRERKEKKALAC